MNPIIFMMANGAKSEFSGSELRQIKAEADRRFRQLTEENRNIPKALKQHTETNIFPAIAAYKTLLEHGLEPEAACDVIRRFFVEICGVMFKPVSWYLHIGGLYHRYPAGMVRHSLRDFSPEAGFAYRMPETENPAVARFDIVSCPYHAMCEKYDCLELNPAFCDSDYAKYGHLHKKLKWARIGTIGKGAPCCDFRIIDTARCPDYRD